MVMPVQGKDPVQKLLDEWGVKSKQYSDTASITQKQFGLLSEQYNKLRTPPLPAYKIPGWKPGMVQEYPYPKDVSGVYLVDGQRYAVTGAEYAKGESLLEGIKDQILAATGELEKSDFYARLYGQVPYAISAGQVKSVDDVLNNLKTPANLTADELAEVKSTVSNMLGSITGASKLPTMAKESQPIELAELVPPKTYQPTPPTSIQKLTVNAIVSMMQVKSVPPQVMSDEEWKKFLVDSGQTDAEGNPAAVDLVKEWQDRTVQLAANKQGMAELPAYKFRERLLDLIMRPGLAMADAIGFYAEHVSQPLAGALWSTMIPDIHAAYVRYKTAGESEREALVHAWQGWDAPGAGNWTPDWILKYVLMEGLVDPLSYVGWGIATKLTKPLGAFGRFVGAAERGFTDVMTLPFDAAKVLWEKAPKSIAQQALLVRARTGQYFKKALEIYMLDKGAKTFRHVSSKELGEFIDAAIKHAQSTTGATSEDALAQAGRDLLLHKSFGEEQVASLAKSLKSSFADDISGRNILEVNNIFEDFFTSKIGNIDVAADRLVKALDGTGENAVKDATTWLTKQSYGIIADARAIAKFPKPIKGMMSLMERNYRYTEDALEGVLVAKSKEMGRVAALFDQIYVTTSRIWSNTIDRFITRPFAQAYLTFGMYGPMNTIEDVIRTVLGGVRPGMKSIEFFEVISKDLLIDTELVTRTGISETYGYLREPLDQATRGNWVLTLGLAPISLPTYGVSALLGRTITPEVFAKGAARYTTELFGAIGMDMRRNFVARKYMQILESSGSKEVKQLMNVVTKFEGTASKSLNKEVYQMVSALALTGDPASIRAAKAAFTHLKIREKAVRQIIEKYAGQSPETRNALITKLRGGELFNATPVEGVVFPVANSIDSTFTELAQTMRNSILKDPEIAAGEIEQLTKLYTEAGINSPAEMAQAMTSLHLVGQTYDLTAKEVIARASKFSRGLPFDERNPMINKALDDVRAFQDRAGSSIDGFVDTIKNNMAKANATPEYVTSASHLLDLRTTKRVKLASINTDFNEWRRSYFVGATKDQLKSSAFWDSFYNRVDDWISKLDVEAINYDSLIDAQVKLVNRAGGYTPPPHTPIIIKDRALAPADVANLLDVQGDDLSKAILDQMTFVHDRPRFIAYVMAQVEGDIGFTPESVGRVYDQLTAGLIGNQKTVDMLTVRELELDAMRKEMHGYYNARTIKPEDIQAIGKYVDEVAESVGKITRQPTIPDYDIGLGERLPKPVEVEGISPIITEKGTSYLVTDSAYLDRIRIELAEAAESVNLPKVIEVVTEEGTMERVELARKGYSTLKDAVDSWFQTSGNEALQDIGRTASRTPEYLAKVRGILKEKYPSGYIRIYRGSGGAKGKALEREYTNVTSSKSTALLFEDTWTSIKDLQGFTLKKPTIDNVLIRVEDVVAIGSVDESELIIKANVLAKYMTNPLPIPVTPTFAFKDYQALRQSSMDEAHKWYYKEYTDYTHGNAIDDLMKHVYPFWTYERSRWNYLPRELVRHPLVATTLGKYINNTENGYIHIPGTNIDINPFRGTVFGTLVSLSRQSYKSYYDSLPLGDYMEFNDWISRYGFYPGAPWNLIMSAMGGQESQFGEALPATPRSLLDVAIAVMPDNKAISWISNKLFPDRFRDYMVAKEVTRRGGNGSVIGRKVRGQEKLTEEEQQLWNDSLSQVSWYSVGFEQFGLFRMRSQDQIDIQKACSQAIYEMTGYTPDQQDWMYDHKIRIWDQVGGMTPAQQAVLEGLNYWKYTGLSEGLMPGNESAIQDRISTDWDAVTKYNETIIMQGQLGIQNDFLSGRIGPNDYSGKLKALYTQKATYMDNRVADNPLMLLENRTDYYKQTGVAQPVMHPMKELLSLYFGVELKEIINPDTGEKMDDWDTFYAERDAIISAIPDEYKAEWDAVMQKNQTRLEGIRRTVYDTYFTKYNDLWTTLIEKYSPEEQRLINEYLSLERLGANLSRQAEIKNIGDSKGRQLISGFRSDVSGAKVALRYANPSLDAWLFYWGKTSSFQTPQAEMIYQRIATETGRKV